jgi:PmbA protein
MNDSKIDRLLELSSQRGVEAEVYYLDSQDTPIEFANNRLKSLSTKMKEGVALRVIADGKLGFASSSDLNRVEDLVEAAIATATIGDSVDYSLATEIKSIEPESNYLFPSTISLTTLGNELIERILAENSEILVDLEFHLRNNRVIVATTKDAYIERNRRTVSASIAGNLVRGEDFLQIDADRIIRDGEPDYQILVEKLIQQYRRASQTVTMNSGTYPILFTPKAAASTIGRGLTALFSGRAIAEKSSAVADKLGQKLFDSRVTIFEDPNRGVAACGFDDEGTPTQSKTLIDRGIVNDFYWDKRWAARVGKQSSGNGFRGGLALPSPSLVNLCLNPGNSTVEELIASIDEGIIIDRVLGGGQSNLLAGEFSVSLALGYKVIKGEIVGRVKNTMVAGNIFQVLDRIRDFSDRPEWVGSRFYLPHILCSQLGVASKQ